MIETQERKGANQPARIICIALLAMILFGCSKRPAGAVLAPQPLCFKGYTNGTVGPMIPMFAKMYPRHAAIIQQWLNTGTNAAIFTITNNQSCTIVIPPFGHVFDAEGKLAMATTPFLDVTNFSGVSLIPGEVADFRTAIIQQNPTLRMRIFYKRTDENIGPIERLWSIITRKPVQQQMYVSEGDLVEK